MGVSSKKRVRHKFMAHPLVLIIFPMLMKYHPENGLARYEWLFHLNVLNIVFLFFLGYLRYLNL